jgi:hypothetical protein
VGPKSLSYADRHPAGMASSRRERAALADSENWEPFKMNASLKVKERPDGE